MSIVNGMTQVVNDVAEEFAPLQFNSNPSIKELRQDVSLMIDMCLWAFRIYHNVIHVD